MKKLSGSEKRIFQESDFALREQDIISAIHTEAFLAFKQICAKDEFDKFGMVIAKNHTLEEIETLYSLCNQLETEIHDSSDKVINSAGEILETDFSNEKQRQLLSTAARCSKHIAAMTVIYVFCSYLQKHGHDENAFVSMVKWLTSAGAIFLAAGQLCKGALFFAMRKIVKDKLKSAELLKSEISRITTEFRMRAADYRARVIK